MSKKDLLFKLAVEAVIATHGGKINLIGKLLNSFPGQVANAYLNLEAAYAAVEALDPPNPPTMIYKT